MKKLIGITMAAVLLISMVPMTVQAAFHGEIPDNGKHYQINIIGVPKGKSAPMDNPDRHTVFVPLGKDEAVACKITVKANTANPTEFEVIDGNGFDDGEVVIAVPYTYYSTLSYNVYAVALGKPFGSVHVDAEVVFEDNTTAGLLMTEFDLARGKGKPTVKNISDIFRASGYIDWDEDGLDADDTTFTNVWVFNVPTLLDYYWTYTNSGLKVMQLRFYETNSGSWTNIPTP